MSLQGSNAPAPWTAPQPLPTGCRTSRLSLCYWQLEDAPAMLAALTIDRESFLPWLPWTLTDNRTVEQCCAAIERQREKRERADGQPEDVVVAIFDAMTGDALGGTGLHRMVHAYHEAEIGYWMRADRRRQGFCTEAVAALVTWAFMPQDQGGWGLRRIHIRCAALNVPSSAVPRRLGFAHEATLRKERWVPGHGWDDTLVFGMLREEWRAAPAGFAVNQSAR
ncbi:MAG: GNAT family protein [Phycisphaerales bacterium]